MSEIIALIARTSEDETQSWLEVLNAALNGREVIAINMMTEEQKRDCRVAIVANPDPADIALLPNLKLIHSLWAGVERLVRELPHDCAPIIRLVDPELTRTMAEAVLAWSYYIQRDMPAYRLSQMAKEWQPRAYRSPANMTIGIVGLGTLGQASAKVLKNAGFDVIGWSRTKKTIDGYESLSGDEGLTQLLQQSDIVVLLLPLTHETSGLMNEKRFFEMKKGAALINFARGPIIEAQAMLKAIEEGQLGHAILDVFNVEPLPPTCPYWHNPSITILPHIAAQTTKETAAKIVAENIFAWQKTRELPHFVNRELGY